MKPEILRNKTVVITGTWDYGPRTMVAALIQQHGGYVTNSVTNNTDILVYGQKPGSKLADAQHRGIKAILSEEQFMEYINGRSAIFDTPILDTVPVAKKVIPDHYGDF